MAAGDFSASERFEIDKAIRAAEETSRYEFSVFVGDAESSPRDFAVGLHSALVAPSRSVLVLVDPVARVIEVVTGSVVKRTLTDHEVQLAILEMQTDFAAGELVGGIKRGINLLAQHARAPHTLHAE
ncbi:DUF5130 family protein [Nocardioides agariphilus]|uniref:DUF5130 family protein n=1 Tax=Nocardioides agariphilus TaxID=433664 RepID=A0A930YG03_9ACTN|nr:DUF5130 family protein [Nocardioides agariphilus]